MYNWQSRLRHIGKGPLRLSIIIKNEPELWNKDRQPPPGCIQKFSLCASRSVDFSEQEKGLSFSCAAQLKPSEYVTVADPKNKWFILIEKSFSTCISCLVKQKTQKTPRAMSGRVRDDKSQGSEWRSVFFILRDTAGMRCQSPRLQFSLSGSYMKRFYDSDILMFQKNTVCSTLNIPIASHVCTYHFL